MEQPILTLPQQPFKDCKSCKKQNAIPSTDSRLSCERCREQRKRYNERKRIRDREKAAFLVSSSRDVQFEVKTFGDMSLQPKKKKQKLAVPAGRPDSPLTKKKKKLNKKTWTEYQTADELYDALRDLVASGTMPEFRGRFSIVMDLQIDHLKRAKIVAKALKNIVKRSESRSITKGDSSVDIRYSCACLANPDPSSTSSTRPHPNPLQNSNGIPRADDKAQANGVKLAEALQASFTRDCKGSVRITTDTDTSHPLGVPGQRISVVVKH